MIASNLESTKQKSHGLYDDAKRQNKDIEGFVKTAIDKRKVSVDKYSDAILELSNNFSQLDEFKGRFLKHIYVHKKEKDEEDKADCKMVADFIHQHPSVFTPQELNQCRLQRIKQMTY